MLVALSQVLGMNGFSSLCSRHVIIVWTDKKQKQGRSATGKTAVIGVKERGSKKVKAEVIDNMKRPTLHGFIDENIETGSTVYTDDFKSYENLDGYGHQSVKHSVSEYVNDQIHINGMESFWSMLKRAHKGTDQVNSELKINQLSVVYAYEDEWPVRITEFIIHLTRRYSSHPRLVHESATQIPTFLDTEVFAQISVHERCVITTDKDPAGRTSYVFNSSIPFNDICSSVALTAFERFTPADFVSNHNCLRPCLFPALNFTIYQTNLSKYV